MILLETGKMEADVAKDCQGVTVHEMSFLHGKTAVYQKGLASPPPQAKPHPQAGTRPPLQCSTPGIRVPDSLVDSHGLTHVGIYYASLPIERRPWFDKTSKDDETNRTENKHRLVCALWNHLVDREDPAWKGRQSCNGTVLPIQVLYSPLGRPQLQVGEYQGPAISFSEAGGKLWAALCKDGSDIGIDAAGTDEFRGEYPFHRVFHADEIQHVLGLVDGDKVAAYALIWSIKEAVAKNLGCAFHLVDPRQITVHPSTGAAVGDNGYTFPVGLSGDALVRFPEAALGSLWVCSFSQEKTWLSIAASIGRGAPQSIYDERT
jgi:hypothetical protein